MKFLTLFFLLLPLSLFAENSNWFVGLEGGTGGVEYMDNSKDIPRKFGLQYGVRAGVVNNTSRIYLGYSKIANNSNKISQTQSAYLGLDGVGQEFNVFDKATAKVFIGATLGASNSTVQDEKVNAFMGGMQIGLIFLLPVGLEIEAAYRHQWNYKNVPSDFNTANPYIALNYKF